MKGHHKKKILFDNGQHYWILKGPLSKKKRRKVFCILKNCNNKNTKKCKYTNKEINLFFIPKNVIPRVVVSCVWHGGV